MDRMLHEGGTFLLALVAHAHARALYSQSGAIGCSLRVRALSRRATGRGWGIVNAKKREIVTP